MKKIEKVMLVLLLLFTGRANGQESTVDIPSITNVSPIVRNFGTEKDIICYSTSGASTFLRVNGASTIVERITLKVDTICDFEILDDTVYFCGMKSNNGKFEGVMGVFPLSPFPYTTVTLYTIPDVESVIELEVRRYAGYTHVVMIGDVSEEERVLIDAVWTGYYWGFEKTYSEKDKYYRDITLVDNYVVAVAANGRYAVEGIVLLFEAPTILDNVFNYSFLNVYYQKRREGSFVPVKVEKGVGNKFVVAELRLTPSRALTLTRFTPFFGMSITMTYSPIFKLNVPDMRSDCSGQVMNILLRQEIYNLSPIELNLLLEPSTFYGTGMKERFHAGNSYISSMGEAVGLPGHFVSAGRNTSTELSVYHYEYGHVGRCSSEYMEYPVQSQEKWDVDTVTILYKRFNENPKPIDIVIGTLEKRLFCEDYFKQ